MKLIVGDCVDVLRRGAANRVDAIVADPPYGLEFMGKEWDRLGSDLRQPFRGEVQTPDNPYGRTPVRYGYNAPPSAMQDWHHAWAVEALRVLKPGSHLLAFGGTRTYHRLACAIEDAGFEIRDTLAWLYGSGFPKSLDVSKAIDKTAGAERKKVKRVRVDGRTGNSLRHVVEGYSGIGLDAAATTGPPVTEAAQRWQGWGTALKPAHEPIVLARKPLSEKTVAANVQRWGTAALNIDGTRIDHQSEADQASAIPQGRATPKSGALAGSTQNENSRDEFKADNTKGRWPANVVMDEKAGAMLDEHSGGASRFFYCAKASKKERNAGGENDHPTVKPVSLMRWLVRMVTPPGGLIVDPFVGSGTTGIAALLEGFEFVGIDQDPHYIEIAAARIAHYEKELESAG